VPHAIILVWVIIFAPTVLSRKNKQSLHPGRNRSTDRKTTKKPHYRISRNSTNATTIFTSANTNSSNKQYYRIRQKLESLLYASYKLGQEILPLCISMPTTAKSITGRKERNSALKSQKKSTRIQGKLKGKSVILLKERRNVNTSSTRQTHAKIWKFKRQVDPELNKKQRIINTSRISTHTSHQSKEPSSKKTAGRSQWPARTSAGKSHCPSHKS